MTVADVLAALDPMAPIVVVVLAVSVALLIVDHVVGWFVDAIERRE